jgi:hypothetical protein
MYPSLALDAAGILHVVWYDNRDMSSEIYHKTFDGMTWSADERLTVESAYSSSPTIAPDDDGGVHVVWYDHRDGNAEIYYKTYDGVVWSEDLRLTNASNTSQKPSVALDPDGSAHVVWQDLRDGNHEIYWRYWYGGILDPPEVTSVDPDTAETGFAYEVINVIGSGFYAGASVRLEQGPGDSIPGENTVVWSPGAIVSELGLGEATPGYWDVIVRNLDGQEARLVDGFFVRPGPWEPDVRLTYDTATSYTSRSNAHCVAADPVGNIHVVWYDRRDGLDEIYYKMFDGVTWSEDQRLTNSSGDARYPSIACASDGDLHLVWADEHSGVWNIYYKHFDGVAWGSNRIIAPVNASQSLPCIAVDADENLHVVWYDTRQSGNDEIYYAKFDGMSWEPDTRLTNASRDSWTPAIVADDYGNLHVAWHDNRTADFEIYYKRFNGSTWEADQRLTNAGGISANAALELDITGKIHLTWNDDRTGNKEIYRRVLDGVVWGPEEQITFCDGMSRQASSVCDHSGNVHVVWQDNRGGDYEIFHKMYDGMAWSADRRLTPDPGMCEHASLAADLTGRVHVVWHDNRDGNQEIYYKQYDPYQFAGVEKPEVKCPSGKPLAVFPNPAALGCRIALALPAAGKAAVSVYDLTGRLVWSRDLGIRGPGPQSVAWDCTDTTGRQVSPGVYFIKFSAGKRVASAKLVVIR